MDRLPVKSRLRSARPAGEPTGQPLGPLLSRASRAFDAEVHGRLVALGYDDVRVAHGAVFARLDPAGATVADLARRAGMTKQAMGELVDDLEAKGYLRRVPDPRDARAKLVRLTASGERHVADARQVLAAVERDIGRRLGARRLRDLRGILRSIATDAVRTAS